ncbi:MAG: hypothetical protein F6J89_20720 [Symploca sp. SIO1C4]|uniref:Uncharacterized protein n=1 Tax=Symploca sp. SIO1C4 TaxID=2607765 RepID=A0A6B3NHE6_9CYAN|nr:hypothetical protein [Symploca sp. SIO1C4]
MIQRRDGAFKVANSLRHKAPHESAARIYGKIQTHRWYSNTLARQPSVSDFLACGRRVSACGRCVRPSCTCTMRQRRMKQEAKIITFDLMLGTSQSLTINTHGDFCAA